MRSAVERLPSFITVLMNLVTSVLPYSASSASSRFAISLRRGIVDPLLLRALRAVFRAALLAALHADRVERAAHDVIPDAGEVLDATAADQDQRVLLKVVPDTGDVGRDLNPVGEPHARHLAERGIRLLRGLGEHPHADATLLRAFLQCRALR